MCCRLRLDNRELRKRGGALLEPTRFTGSIGVVTINLARRAIWPGTAFDYFKRPGQYYDLPPTGLETKRKILESLTDAGLYPYSQFYLRNVKEGFGQFWKNHFSTIGIIGMNESCLNFLGCDIASEQGMSFAQEVMDYMRERLVGYQEETGSIFNLEATPAEGVTYGIARKDKAAYPDIMVANEVDYRRGAEPFYTNSTQLPVNYTDDLFRALNLQEPLQSKYTGGTVFHIFLGESIPSIESTKKMIKKVCENFTLPYFTLSPTFSICPSHGYLAGQKNLCPHCEAAGKETMCEVYSRVVGYIRPIDQWNAGKQAEFENRKLFDRALQQVQEVEMLNQA